MTLIELAYKLRPYIEKAAQSLDDTDAIEAVQLYPNWVSGVAYEVDMKLQYHGILYRVLQSHTSQETWTPDAAHSLFAKVLIPDANVIPEWEQPESTNPYMKGDKVTHNDKNWVSIIDDNVWEPGVYGWEEWIA